jgi:dihydroorotase-like cyclic amidohydrolase
MAGPKDRVGEVRWHAQVVPVLAAWPESGLDAIRNVGVSEGSIRAISAGRLSGTRALDATGLVVAPGFVDLHRHGQASRDA